MQRSKKHRNTLFHIKTNLCNGSQIIMHKLLVHEFSIWTYCPFFFQKGNCIESIYLRKENKDILSSTYFRSPPSLYSSGTWMGQKILPKLYHNSTLCSLILKVKPTLSFGPLIICITFVGFSLGQCLIGKMHFRKALIAP